MKNSKFLTLFRTCGEEEVSEFKKYLNRFHSVNSIQHSVFSYCRKLYPSFGDDKKLDIKYAYRKIFHGSLGDDPYNRTKFLNILSDLHLCLKEFLMLKKLKMDTLETKVFWMEILRERGLNAEYGRQANKLQEAMADKPRTSIPEYMQGMVANYHYYYHLSHDKLSENIHVLQGCGHSMDVFYAVCRLKLACEMANRKNQISLEYSPEVLPAVMELATKGDFSDHPLLPLYWSVYELIASRQPRRFFEIESMLNKQIQVIEPDELHTILSYLYNFAAIRIRQGDETYWELTHRLNQFGAKNGIFLKSGAMNPGQFNNIVNAACRAKDFAWALSFIKSHQKLLPKDLKGNTLILAESIFLFEKGMFKDALNKLGNVELTDLYHALRSKSLMLRCHYEINDAKLDIENFCLSFEAFLKRHRKPKQEAVEATLNFTRIVKMLIRKRVHKEKLIQEIEETKPLYFKSWLLEKATGYKDL